MTPQEIPQNFKKEFKELLLKYKAQIFIEDFGKNFQTDEKIVVEFEYDSSFFEEYGTGEVPKLILGTYEDGNP